MQEIAEIQNEIRKKIEKKRKEWVFIVAWLKYLFGSFPPYVGALIGSLGLSVIVERKLLGGLFLITEGNELEIIARYGFFSLCFIVFVFLTIVYPIRKAKREKEVLFSINEKDVIDEVRRLYTGEEKNEGKDKGKRKYHHSYSPEKLNTDIKLFYGVINWKDIEKMKVVVNYDFEMSSYPNPLGANLRWTVYEELKNAGLVCDGKVKGKIAEKVMELGGEQ
jgi:hypothetical protein